MAREVSREPNAQRLTTLRSIFGLTQANLAERLGVTQSFLSHLTRGSRPIPDSLIEAMADEFGLPQSFFFVPTRTVDGTVATFRKSSTASVRDENRVVALFDEAARTFAHLSSEIAYQPARLPNPQEVEGDVELVAESFRELAGLGVDEPVPNATRMIERLGIGVVDNLDHLKGEATGHAGVSRPAVHSERPLIALATPLPGAVKRLTVMHEVGHLIFDRELTAPMTSTRHPVEKRAFKFGSAVLLPEQVIRDRVSPSLNLHGYLPIKAEFGVSVGAIIIRARDLGVIPPDRARSLQIQLSSQGWRKDEPVPVADERPVLLRQALQKGYGVDALPRLAHEVGTSADWIAAWAGVEVSSTEPAAAVVRLADVRARRSAG